MNVSHEPAEVWHPACCVEASYNVGVQGLRLGREGKVISRGIGKTTWGCAPRDTREPRKTNKAQEAAFPHLEPALFYQSQSKRSL